ncbi:MAG TPA: TlpA disulfide reductase family protein, partial [Chitinophagaceae bacterium]
TLFKKIKAFSPYFASNEGVLFYTYLFNYVINKKGNPKFVDDQLYSRYSSYTKEQRTVLDSLKYYSNLSNGEENQALKNLHGKEQELFLVEIEKINTSNLLHLIDSLYTPPQSDILKTFLLAKAKNAFVETYPEIIKSMQTNWCRDIARMELRQTTLKQKQIDSLLAKATRINDNYSFIGQPLEFLPFNADLYKLDSIKDVDEFIVNLKSKFPNKALVIDFWATWCAPCLKELPVSKQLHEENKDLPIAFIYICTNSSSNITVWKNKIVGLQLPGTHIFADDKLVTELKSKFDLAGAGFPTYVVIDGKGKLKPKAIDWMSSLDRDGLKNAVGL